MTGTLQHKCNQNLSQAVMVFSRLLFLRFNLLAGFKYHRQYIRRKANRICIIVTTLIINNIGLVLRCSRGCCEPPRAHRVPSA